MVTNSIQRDKDTSDSAYWASNKTQQAWAGTRGAGRLSWILIFPTFELLLKAWGCVSLFSPPGSSALPVGWGPDVLKCWKAHGALRCYFWLGLNSQVLERMFLTRLAFWEFMMLCLVVPGTHSDNKLVDRGIQRGQGRRVIEVVTQHTPKQLSSGWLRASHTLGCFIYLFICAFIKQLYLSDIVLGTWQA